MTNTATKSKKRTRATTGQIIIISSPSGGGKTSICRRVLSPARKRQGWRFSISYTTRAKRPGERDGREYFFVDEARFQQLVQAGFFAEHFKVHLYNYGTPRGPLESVRHTGGVMLLDVDVHGADRIKLEYPEAVTIFILPPTIAALRRRLKRRGTETKEQLEVRFQNALSEVKRWSEFDYVVINQELEEAVRQVLSIIAAHPRRTDVVDREQIAKLLR